MVVISRWPTLPTFVMQERTATPSSKTVHAPHWPSPQPYFGPVKSISSRRTLRRLLSPSTLTATVRPLTRRSMESVFGAGGFNHLPEFRVFLKNFIFARREAGAEEEIFESVAAEDAMDDHAEVVPLEINAIIAEAKAMEGLAVALEFAEMLEIALHGLLGKAAKFAEDVKLQFPGHLGQFRGADGVEDDLELHHGPHNSRARQTRKGFCPAESLVKAPRIRSELLG